MRLCILCKKQITLCNGHALCRDVGPAVEGKLAWSDVREVCPMCEFSGKWDPETWVDPRKNYTREALSHMMKLRVERNLKKDSHYYDAHVASYVACVMCHGTGELSNHEDVGEWESEGGSITPHKLCACGGERVRITEDMVRRFFELPMPSQYIKIGARRSGSCGFDVSIHVSLNPALQDAAMQQLDALLFDGKNFEWLMGIYPWTKNYEIGISLRHFSGDAKESQLLLLKWFKNCEQKIGKKNLSIESQMQL